MEELEEFLKEWPLTKEELGMVTGKKPDTVNNWFYKGVRHRDPTPDVIDRLKFLHLLWKRRQDEEDLLPGHFFTVYDAVKFRKDSDEQQKK